MVISLLVVSALAVDALPRFDEPLTVRDAMRVTGDGPARAWQRRGPLRVWLFPDGHVEHQVLREGGVSVELVRYDAQLARHLTVTYDAGQPDLVRVEAVPRQEVDVRGWQDAALSGVTLRLPRPDVGDDVVRADVSPGRFVARWVDETVDVTADALVDDLELALGGRLIARSTAWIDARPAARMTFALPDPDIPRVVEVWAVPRPGGVFVASYTAPRGAAPASMDTLAPGRAAMALVHWEDA